MMNSASSTGSQTVLDGTIGSCYPRLLQIASYCLRSEPFECDMEPSELVHEAYLRLFHLRTTWQDNLHFLNLTAQMMRCILCDGARARYRLKRGARCKRVALDAVNVPSEIDVESHIAARERMRQLGSCKERWSRVVELRVQGFSVAEIAAELRVSRRTVKRDWQMAKSAMRR